jgi:hypothetical protein
MTNMDVKTWSAARRALEKAVTLYVDDPNVSLVDLGFRACSATPHHLDPELVVRVHVRQKIYGNAFREFAMAEPGRVIEAQRVGFALDVPEANYRSHLWQDPSAEHNESEAGDRAIPFAKLWDGGLEIGAAGGVVIPQLGMRVIRSGVGASVASGIVTGVLGYSLHRDGGAKHLLGPLVHISPEASNEKICAPGDSGTWWLEASTRRVVALHFAGSDDPNCALAFSMPEVLAALEANAVLAPAEPIETQICEKLAEVPAPAAIKAIPSSTPERTTQRTYRIAYAGLLLALGMTIAGFCYHQQQVHRQQRERIAQLQRQLQRLNTIAQTDGTRQQQIQRILAIIDRFNNDMTEELKFRIAAEIYEMSLKYSRLNVELICATITHETGRTWNPQAISPAGALGLMQILPSTAIYLARAEGLAWTSAEGILFDPISNLRLGCRYLDELISNYGVEAGLAAYNGGDRQAKLWLQGGRANQLVHAETAHYVPAVLRIYEEYRR